MFQTLIQAQGIITYFFYYTEVKQHTNTLFTYQNTENCNNVCLQYLQHFDFYSMAVLTPQPEIAAAKEAVEDARVIKLAQKHSLTLKHSKMFY